VSYTFRVGGGTDPKEGSKYHPLYFTNDVEGGYNQVSRFQTCSAVWNYRGSCHASVTDDSL